MGTDIRDPKERSRIQKIQRQMKVNKKLDLARARRNYYESIKIGLTLGGPRERSRIHEIQQQHVRVLQYCDDIKDACVPELANCLANLRQLYI